MEPETGYRGDREKSGGCMGLGVMGLEFEGFLFWGKGMRVTSSLSVPYPLPQPQSQRQERGERRSHWMDRNTGRGRKGKRGIWAREVMGGRTGTWLPGEIRGGGVWATKCLDPGWIAVPSPKTVQGVCSLGTWKETPEV